MASSKAPPPKRQKTIEVDISWLEEEAPKRKKPPRLPGASRTIPPMPVSERPKKPIPRED